MANESSEIVWQAPEYEYDPKDVSWYWISLILAVVLLAVSLWQKNFLFAIFIVIAEVLLISFAGKFPPIWEFKIDELGIGIGKHKFYPYNELESFDIQPGGEEYKELALRRKAKTSPYLMINILKDDEEKIKNFLLRFLPQKEHSGSTADAISKFLRF